MHNSSVGFSLKKQGESSVDLRTPVNSDPTANVRIIYGGQLAKELLEVRTAISMKEYKMKTIITVTHD